MTRHEFSLNSKMGNTQSKVSQFEFEKATPHQRFLQKYVTNKDRGDRSRRNRQLRDVLKEYDARTSYGLDMENYWYGLLSHKN